MTIPSTPQRFATLGDARVFTVGCAGGAAQRSGLLLADLGATTHHLMPPSRKALADTDPAAWDVLIVDGVPSMIPASWAADGVEGIACVISAPGDNDFDESAELTAQAAAGFLWANGASDDPPIQCGVPVAESAGALAATLAVVAAHSARTGGEPLEVIHLDMVQLLLGSLGTILPHYLLTGQEPPRLGNRHALTAPWNSYPGADGWVVLATMGERQWATVASVLGRPELVDDPRFRTPEDRIRNAAELDAIIAAWTADYPKLDLVKLADEAGVPLSPVLTAAEALGHPAWQHRLKLAAGVTGQRLFIRGIADTRPHSPEQPGKPARAALPLTGLRVLEVGLYTAAPLAGKLLAQLGADVLKVEPPAGEPGRRLGAKLLGSSYLYYLNNTDKRGCVVDMTSPDGRAVMAELVTGADVFLTNLSLDGLGRDGLGFDDLAAVNPGIIYCSISGYGATGPNAGTRVLDTVMQAMSGIMHLTGRPDGPPTKIAVSICDLMAAWVAAVSIVAAWRDRATAGRAQFLDASMLDASMWMVRAAVGDGDASTLTRQGTGDLRAALHDVLGTADADVALCSRDPDRRDDFISDTCGGAAGDVSALAEWIARSATADVVTSALSHRISAAPLARLIDAAAAALIELPLADGSHKVFGSPFTWPVRNVAVRRAAPSLGEHDAKWLPRGSESRHHERAHS